MLPCSHGASLLPCSLPAKPKAAPPVLRALFQAMCIYPDFLTVQHLPEGLGGCPWPSLWSRALWHTSEGELALISLNASCVHREIWATLRKAMVGEVEFASWLRQMHTDNNRTAPQTAPLPVPHRHTQATSHEAVFAAVKTYLYPQSFSPLAEELALLSECSLRCLSDGFQNGRSWSKAGCKLLFKCISQLKVITISLWTLLWAWGTRWKYWPWWLLFCEAVSWFGCRSPVAACGGRVYQPDLKQSG